MSFFKRTQEELDAAFLKAVAEYRFSKAKRLLGRGANIQARDADGNTALHKMARNDPDSGDSQRDSPSGAPNYRLVDEFVCFLLVNKADINATNKYGKTCLHYAAANQNDYEGKITGILLNRGANPNIADNAGMTPLHHVLLSRPAVKLVENGARISLQDMDGKTPLHLVASRGNDFLVNLYLNADRSATAIMDKEGKYPHESAIAGPVGNHMLSRLLLSHLNAYRAEMQRLKRQKELESSSVPVSKNDWFLLQAEQVAHVQVDKGVGYKMTEIFNFHARTYTAIVQNLETKVEATAVKSFDDFPDPTLLKDGYDQLIRLGGKAEESAIYKQILNKDTPKLPRPGAGHSGI